MIEKSRSRCVGGIENRVGRSYAPTPFDRKLNSLSIDIGDDVMMTHHDSFKKKIYQFLSKKIMKNHEFLIFFGIFGISSSS